MRFCLLINEDLVSCGFWRHSIYRFSTIVSPKKMPYNLTLQVFPNEKAEGEKVLHFALSGIYSN